MAIRELSLDRERLAWIAKTVAVQGGIGTASLGAMLFVMEITDVFRWVFLIMLPVVVLYYFAYQRWIPDYYQKRFGRVEAREPTGKGCVIALAILFGLFLFSLFFGGVAIRYLSSVSGWIHLMIFDPAHQINLLPLALWTGLFLSSLASRPSKTERQQRYFLFLGMVAFAFVTFIAVWDPGVRQIALWRILNAGGPGLTLIALGLHDHIRLLVLLPKGAERNDD
jgi:hypothetical protein